MHEFLFIFCIHRSFLFRCEGALYASTFSSWDIKNICMYLQHYPLSILFLNLLVHEWVFHLLLYLYRSSTSPGTPTGKTEVLHNRALGV